MGFTYPPPEFIFDNKEDEKRFKKDINNIYRKTESLRGFILTRSIGLEDMLIDILASFFIRPNNLKREFYINLRRTFIAEIISDISFRNKIRIIKNIISRNFPKFKIKHKDYLNKLIWVKDIRNVIAHGTFSVDNKCRVYLESGSLYKVKKMEINNDLRKKFHNEIKNLLKVSFALKKEIKPS